MGAEFEDIPGITDDPVFQLVYSGQAASIFEAEQMYLQSSMPELLELLASPLSNEQLERHPLIDLWRRQGPRGWEDSPL